MSPRTTTSLEVGVVVGMPVLVALVHVDHAGGLGHESGDDLSGVLGDNVVVGRRRRDGGGGGRRGRGRRRG